MLHTYVIVERIPRLFGLTGLSREEKAVGNAVVKENVVFWVFLGAQKYSCWVGLLRNSSTQAFIRYFHLLGSKPLYAKTKDKMLVVPDITKCNGRKKKSFHGPLIRGSYQDVGLACRCAWLKYTAVWCKYSAIL